jgi:amino acid transporter
VERATPAARGELHRALSRWDGLAVAVGSVIGVGIFRVTGEVYRGAGSTFATLGVWVGLGLLTLVGSLVYADLSVRVPEDGGAYAYVREAFGVFPSFLDGWITVAAVNPAIQGVGAALIGELMARMLHVPRPRLFGVMAIVGLVAINWVGVRAGARSQRVFTSFKLLALGGVVVLSLWPVGQQAPVATSFQRTTLIGALAAAWYAYLGWQDAALLAEDLREPRRDLPAVLVGSVVVIVTVYLLVNGAILYAAHGSALAAADEPALEIAKRVLGTNADRLMSGVILVSMIGGTAEGFLVHPRLSFALARDGLAPALLAQVNRGGTPQIALLFHGVLVALLVVSNTFLQILALLVFAQTLQAVLEVSSYFVLRRRIPEPRLTPLHPLLGVAFVTLNATLGVWVAWQNPICMIYSAAAIGVATVAYLVYWLARRRRAPKV